MEQGGGDCGRIQAHVSENLRDGDTMRDIRQPGFADLALVRNARAFISPVDQVAIADGELRQGRENPGDVYRSGYVHCCPVFTCADSLYNP